MADLTAEFVEKILSLSPTEEFSYFDLTYTSKPLHLVSPPKFPHVDVITLTALADLYAADFEVITGEATVFHVTSEVGVDVYSNESNEYGQRKFFARASFKAQGGFSFGQWLDQETFIIGLQTFFVDGSDKSYLLDLTSKISTNDALEIHDNGTTQEFTAKAGTSLNKSVTPKPRVTLEPYRTFREILQPASEFVFRVRKGAGGAPQLALFEADGGSWKLTAMERIAGFLKNAIANDSATVIY